MAKAKGTEVQGRDISLKILDLVEELFIETVEELKAIQRLDRSNWVVYETLRDTAFAGLQMCESLTQRANPTGPNVGTRREESPPNSPAETD